MQAGDLPKNGGAPLWEVWGDYTHDFARTEDEWRITGMVFEAIAERGSDFLRNTPGSSDGAS